MNGSVVTYLGNSYDDFHLIPKTRPLVEVPSPKTNYVDIPGGNGSLDFTDALNGYPVYNNRSGNWEFYVENGHGNWADLYSNLLAKLHGKRMMVVLEDDIKSVYNEYYQRDIGAAKTYIGRLSVGSWKSDKDWSSVTINYDFEPYAIFTDYSIWPTTVGASYTGYKSSYSVYMQDIYLNPGYTTTKSGSFKIDYSGIYGINLTSKMPVCPYYVCCCSPQTLIDSTIHVTLRKNNSSGDIFYDKDVVVTNKRGDQFEYTNIDINSTWFQDPELIINPNEMQYVYYTITAVDPSSMGNSDNIWFMLRYNNGEL